jgi:hypothetical protein
MTDAKPSTSPRRPPRIRARLLQKLNDAATRIQSEPPAA